MSRSKQVPYQAQDEDYDEDGNYIGQEGEEEEWEEQQQADWLEGLEGVEHEGEEDEGDYGEGVIVMKPYKPPQPQTDLDLQHYLDPLALVNAWEGALQDLKAMHPERFLPPKDAPLSHLQQQKKAPFWHGPPPSAASTSTLPIPPPSVPSALPPTSFRPSSVHSAAAPSEVSASEQPKKRKRLTGSQKKARKQAKLDAVAQAGGSGGAQGETFAEEQAIDEDDGPSWQPDEPPHFEEPVIAAAESSPSRPEPQSLPTVHPAHAAPSPPRVPHPSSFSFVVPPMGQLPFSIPPPPPITPLTGDEPPLEAESPSQLMEAMLWSYYTAGYQTALYHAAVGVAKFKPDELGQGEEAA
ncbi:hypothetical protein JCM11641_006762 [Rhodosporidiobolus odoratus]